jgi:hypothetical protein
MEKATKQTAISVEERLNRISERIEGLRTGQIPLSTPILRRHGDHFWVDQERAEKNTGSD